MNQLKVAKILKGYSLVVGGVGLIFFVWYIPNIVYSAAYEMAEVAYLACPGVIGIWCIGVLCYLALYYFWKICTCISIGNGFSKESALYMKKIGILAWLVCLLIIAGDFILLIFNSLNGAMIIFTFFVIIAGVGIAIICWGLSQLILNAAMIKDENDLTI